MTQPTDPMAKLRALAAKSKTQPQRNERSTHDATKNPSVTNGSATGKPTSEPTNQPADSGTQGDTELTALQKLARASGRTVTTTTEAPSTSNSKPREEPATETSQSGTVATDTSAKESVTTKATTTSVTDETDEIAQFRGAIAELEKMIDNEDPIRDATLNIMKLCQSSEHVQQFLYDNEATFAIGLRALRQLHSGKADARAERRHKAEKKADKVHLTMDILSDIEL